MTQKLISEEKIYELALAEKKHYEATRDNINNQYIALFSAIIAVAPFINNITAKVDDNYEDLIIQLSLILLSIIGLILAIIWSANLKRILFAIESLDKMIMELEQKHNITFTSYLIDQLRKKQSPDRITKYHLTMPRMFIVIFTGIIVYSAYWAI